MISGARHVWIGVHPFASHLSANSVHRSRPTFFPIRVPGFVRPVTVLSLPTFVSLILPCPVVVLGDHTRFTTWSHIAAILILQDSTARAFYFRHAFFNPKSEPSHSTVDPQNS